ncbi:MAG: ATP-dependent Clp protease ATP-binding subunit [Armatimonadetes bacterium]|nr:ATP-dependent Clp protease ATP-binding subunit [Armatimonadota bacterium]
MSSQSPELSDLTPWARRFVQSVHSVWLREPPVTLGLNHWLSELVAQAPRLAAALVPEAPLADLAEQARAALAAGEAGDPLDVGQVITVAAELAEAKGQALASAECVARAILTAAGLPAVSDPADLSTILAAMGAAEAAPPRRWDAEDGDEDDPRHGLAHEAGSRKRRGGTLAQYGHDLTAAAAAGQLAPVLGRESEVQMVVETLCRRTKRNPALIGPAGVGKTAIAEALAQRIHAGDVPAMLAGKRVIALPASSLVAGAGVVGELEQRMEKLLEEAKRQNAILFIDELHTIVGAGSSSTHRSGDVANMLKPGLARGDFACIAATTDDEYRQYIEPDSALERRFQPIRINEMTPAETLAILDSLATQFQKTHAVTVDRTLLSWLVDFAGRFMHNRFFPDKAIDLLEQCVAHATAAGQTTVDRAVAETVAQRMVGMPLDLDNRLRDLVARLSQRALLTDPEVDALYRRLAVTLRGLDIRPKRPNAVLLLLADAAAASESIASTIAEALYGAPDRVVSIDLSSYVDPSHVSMLVGSGPGYVGYQDTLPLHRVAQTPWCVLRFDHIDACHPSVREVIRQGVSDGFLTLGDGKRLYLSDTVVQMTAALSPEGRRTAGFRHTADSDLDAARARGLATRMLGEALVEEVDVLAFNGPRGQNQRRRWLREQILPELTRRYHERRLNVAWDDGVLDWLVNKGHTGDLRDWERLVENQVAPLLIPYLPQADEGEVSLTLAVGADGDPSVEVAS